MLEDVLDAFVAGDSSQGAERDRRRPRHRRSNGAPHRRLSRPGWNRTPRPSRAGVATIFFAKHLERMADHATNIAEMVVYLVQGQDVRHTTSS